MALPLLGHGSSFTVTIDAGSLKSLRMAESLRAAKGEPMHARPAKALRRRVVFAEEFSDAQHLICFYLKSLGLEVNVAGTERVACEMAEHSKAEGDPMT